MLVYSRDAMSHPLRLMVGMIGDVVQGKFKPDLTRSGMMAAEAGVDLSQLDDISDSSSAHGSEDEDDLELCEEEKAAEQVTGALGKPYEVGGEGQQFVRHITSRCLHAMADEAGTHLVCGRVMSHKYEMQPGKPRFFHPACGSCFKEL